MLAIFVLTSLLLLLEWWSRLKTVGAYMKVSTTNRAQLRIAVVSRFTPHYPAFPEISKEPQPGYHTSCRRDTTLVLVYSSVSSYSMAPPPRHERYNAKARGSVAGGSSHKKRKRPPPKVRDEDHSDDAGGEEDGTESLAAIAKRMSGGEGISGKRRKRLESYIVSPRSLMLCS